MVSFLHRHFFQVNIRNQAIYKFLKACAMRSRHPRVSVFMGHLRHCFELSLGLLDRWSFSSRKYASFEIVILRRVKLNYLHLRRRSSLYFEDKSHIENSALVSPFRDWNGSHHPVETLKNAILGQLRKNWLIHSKRNFLVDSDFTWRLTLRLHGDACAALVVPLLWSSIAAGISTFPNLGEMVVSEARPRNHPLSFYTPSYVPVSDLQPY